MLVGLLSCSAFVAISYFAGQQPENPDVLIKTDRLVRTAGNPAPAN